MAKHNTIGRFGEDWARRFLERKDYVILDVNWRARNKEIDIIAQDGNTIVFVEVKTRSSKKWGSPSNAVTKKKQEFLIEAADEFLKQKEIDKDARFDVLAVVNINGNVSVDHIINAFYPEL